MIIRRIDTFSVITEMETDDENAKKNFEFETKVDESDIWANFVETAETCEGGADKWESKIQIMDGDQVVAESRVGADRSR